MGLRARLKRRVKGVVGRLRDGGDGPQEPADTKEVVASVPRVPPSPAPASSAAVAPTVSAPSAPVTVEPPVPSPVASTPDPGAAGSAVSEEAKRAEKAARHLERTRKAVLRFVLEAGGTAQLADMHDYSERRYFIGHKRFSDLMESLVEEALIDYDHAASQATITAQGRAYIG